MITTSIIIPTYKPQQYLDFCLASLDKQTMSKDNYEVLVILNGEKEPYFSAIQKTLEGYSFQSNLLHTSTTGVSNARNIGLNYAKGEYVAFIDDDDYVSPSYIKDLYELTIKNTSAIVVCNVLAFREPDMGFVKDYIGNAYEHFTASPSNSIFKKRKFLSSSCCKLIPNSIINNRRFNTRLKLSEDAIFMFEVSDKIQEIVLAPKECIYYRRLRANSASRKEISFKQKIQNKKLLIIAISKIYMKYPLRYNLFLFLSRIVAILNQK